MLAIIGAFKNANYPFKLVLLEWGIFHQLIWGAAEEAAEVRGGGALVHSRHYCTYWTH